jgi:2-keto-4-pentenoate hydratase/2-oxohepta-3-ene-1,7-dioic acid hydratase in catechol pathway
VVELPEGGNVDWEVELTAVIGKTARNVTERDGWSYVAGLTIGQDISERRLQMASPAPQFSLAKSLPGFSPMGPDLVTVDEFDNPDDLALSCEINGESVQDGRTLDLIFSVPRLIEYLSALLPLYPGDVIFTGTPSGVGMGRSPQRWLQNGDVLVSRIEGIGEIRQTFAGAQK